MSYLFVGMLIISMFAIPDPNLEGCCHTRLEACASGMVWMFVVTGMLNGFDSLIERWLDKCGHPLARHWLLHLAVRPAGAGILTGMVCFVVNVLLQDWLRCFR